MKKESNKFAIDAIKKAENKNAVEKLVLFQLSSKHDMGSKQSVNWKSLDNFIDDFSEKWQSLGDLAEKTQLSLVKVSRAIETLEKDKLITRKTVDTKTKKAKVIGKHEVISLTPTIFENYKNMN